MKRNWIRLIKKHGKETALRAAQLSGEGEGPNFIALYLGVHFLGVASLIDAGRELLARTSNFTECFHDA